MSQIEMIESETFTLDEVAEFLSRNQQVDQNAYEKYNREFSQNQEVQTKTREVFIHFTRKIFELMEQHLEIDRFDEETDGLDMIVDPTNLGVERSFGIMKFYESRFTSLTFGTLSALTISKFNDLPQWLDTLTDEKLLGAHNSERTNQSISRDEHLIQEIHMQMNTERSLRQVSLCFL